MHIIIHVTFNNTSVHVFHNFEMNHFIVFLVSFWKQRPSMCHIAVFSNKSFAFLFVTVGGLG